MSTSKTQSFSLVGGLIALGIIFGDIGTSPLYAFKAIIGTNTVSPDLVLGGLSCIFWTLTLVTTVKYIFIAFSANNNGEGGVFALYTLVRKNKAKWVIYPTIFGCAALIADGFITPSISITSAVEGAVTNNPNFPVIPVVITILVLLFLIQQFGTNFMGSMFGPVMLFWFLMIGAIGGFQIIQHPYILKAINPMYAYDLLVHYPQGFWLLGSVFLCTTGAEALYADMGHCGKTNIRVSWALVKTCLLLNYFGQGSFLLTLEGKTLGALNPFYEIVPVFFKNISIIIATFAAIIASQALISGTFTLVNEAIKLKLWPDVKVRYPSKLKGQVYLPSINWMLLIGTIAVVLLFKTSSAMEGAYGLTILFDMLMASTLMVYFFFVTKQERIKAIMFAILFFSIEISFLVASFNKLFSGGWFSVAIAITFFFPMFILLKARQLRAAHTQYVELDTYIPMIKALQHDDSIPKKATNLVYLTVVADKKYIDYNIIYSILKKQPKKADVYWFVHVETVDTPYASNYSVETIIPCKCFFVHINLGFKADHRTNPLFNYILKEMAENKEVDLRSSYASLRPYNLMADFKFIILQATPSIDSEISAFENMIMAGYNLIKKFSLSPEEKYGLESAHVEVESVPIIMGYSSEVHITRESHT